MTLNSDQYRLQQPGQLLQPAACPQVHNSDPNTSIKQAVAIAIVRHKRRANQEAEEWRAKAQRLEAQLQEQAAGNAALKEWATSIFNSSSSAKPTAGTRHAQRGRRLAKNIIHDSPAEQASPVAAAAGIFLPPLTLPTSGAAAAAGPGDGPYSCNTASCAPALQDSYQALFQQLLLTAQASSTCGAASSVLNGKAASLSDMLLTNMRMLLRLQQLGNSSNTPNPSSASNSTAAAPQALGAMSGGLQDSWPTETMATLSSFITGTLLQVPGSSLQRAYMQQCAALLAALLAHLPATQPEQEQQQHIQHQKQPAEAGRPLQQQLHKQQQASQAGAVAVQAVNLMQQLLTEKMSASSSATSSATTAAASAMLQQLSTFPSTALLLALAVAQQLQRLVQQLQQANAAASVLQLGKGFSFSQLQQSSKALAVAAELFEASHGLLEELVRLCCLQHVQRQCSCTCSILQM
jgi:hypothetical protein